MTGVFPETLDSAPGLAATTGADGARGFVRLAESAPFRANARFSDRGRTRSVRGGPGFLPVCVRVRRGCEHDRMLNEAHGGGSVPDPTVFLRCSANTPPAPSDARLRRPLRRPGEFIRDGSIPGEQGFHVGV